MLEVIVNVCQFMLWQSIRVGWMITYVRGDSKCMSIYVMVIHKGGMEDNLC